MSFSLLAALLAVAPIQSKEATGPLIVEGNVPIVELELKRLGGGFRKARFAIDTGGGAFILGSKLMDEVTKPLGASVQEEGEQFVRLTMPTAQFQGLSLDLAGVPIIGVPGNVRALPRNDVEGLIPGCLLCKYDVVFDYPGHHFTLAAPGTLAHLGKPLKISVGKRNGFPRIEAEIAGKKYGFLLDTGGSFTMLTEPLVKEFAKPVTPTTGAVGFANMFGGPTEASALMTRIAEVKLGDDVLTGVGVVSRQVGTFEKYMSGMMPAPIVGSIAGNVLRDYRVQIDYAGTTVYLTRAGHSVDADQVTVGLVLRARLSGEFEVSSVSSGADPAVAKDIHTRDILVSVGDHELKGGTLAAAALALSGDPGTKKRLVLKRDGKTMEFLAPVKQIL